MRRQKGQRVRSEGRIFQAPRFLPPNRRREKSRPHPDRKSETRRRLRRAGPRLTSPSPATPSAPSGSGSPSPPTSSSPSSTSASSAHALAPKPPSPCTAAASPASKIAGPAPARPATDSAIPLTSTPTTSTSSAAAASSNCSPPRASPWAKTSSPRWLKSPSTHAEILERQQLVAELRDKLDLQRDLGVMGEELRARLNPESLVAWAEGKREMPGAVWHFAAIFLALAFVATFAWSIAELNSWPVLVRARPRNCFPPRALPSRTPRQRRRFLQRGRLGAFRRCLATIGARALRIATTPIVDGRTQSRWRHREPLDSPARSNRILDRRAPQLDRPHSRTPAALFHPGRVRRRVVAPPPRSPHARQRRSRRRNRSADFARDLFLRASRRSIPRIRRYRRPQTIASTGTAFDSTRLLRRRRTRPSSDLRRQMRSKFRASRRFDARPSRQRFEHVRQEHAAPRRRHQHRARHGRSAGPREIPSPLAAASRHANPQHRLTARRPLHFLRRNPAHPQSLRPRRRRSPLRRKRCKWRRTQRTPSRELCFFSSTNCWKAQTQKTAASAPSA